MHKKILLISIALFALLVLSGCVEKPVCGNQACELGEKEPESPFYCQTDCIEKPAAETTGEPPIKMPAGEEAVIGQPSAEEQPAGETTQQPTQEQPVEEIQQPSEQPTGGAVGGTAGGTAIGGVNGISQPPTTQQPPVQQPTQPQTVTPMPQAPTANINADKTSGNAPLTVNLSGTGSTDTDGNIVKYEWDFESNGIFDANGSTVAKSFSNAGIYTIILKVTDNQGLTGTKTISINVSQAAQPPTARISTDKNSGNAPLTVNFNAASSTAVNGATITKYEWDFTNNSVFDSNGSTASYLFSNAGTFTTVLKVTDSKGLTDTETITITVSAAQQQVYKQVRKTCSNPDTTCGLMNVIARLYNHCWDYDCSFTATLSPYPKLTSSQKPADFWADLTDAPLASETVNIIVVWLYAYEQLPQDKINILKASENDERSFNYSAKWFKAQAQKYGVNLNINVYFSDVQYKVPDEYIIDSYAKAMSNNLTKYVKDNFPQYAGNYDVIVPFYYSSTPISYSHHVSSRNSFELFSVKYAVDAYNPSFDTTEYSYSASFAHELAHIFGATDKYTCQNTASAECTNAKANGIGCWIESDNPSEKGKDLMCHRVPFYEGGQWWFTTPSLAELIAISETAKELGWYDFDNDGILEVNDPCRYQFVIGPC